MPLAPRLLRQKRRARDQNSSTAPARGPRPPRRAQAPITLEGSVEPLKREPRRRSNTLERDSGTGRQLCRSQTNTQMPGRQRGAGGCGGQVQVQGGPVPHTAHAPLLPGGQNRTQTNNWFQLPLKKKRLEPSA